ncbi:hypothetical protein M0804_012319 [Polistes exclamans]|nr:hypothetical protein M0804_012319 [Polistes exclamans]
MLHIAATVGYLHSLNHQQHQTIDSPNECRIASHTTTKTTTGKRIRRRRNCLGGSWSWSRVKEFDPRPYPSMKLRGLEETKDPGYEVAQLT